MTLRKKVPSSGFSKQHPIEHRKAVLLAQVAINPHRKGAAVLVAEPSADGRDVHAGLDASGGEEVPEVVVGEVRVPQDTASNGRL